MPKTISAALTWAHSVLVEAGVDSPCLDAELLLAHVVGWQRAQLYTHAGRILQPQEQARFAELIARRAKREPLPYLLGHWEFYGLNFRVDRRVFIPRPETELLVERAIELAKESRDAALRPYSIADVGTGCGAIAIALALHLPSAEVYAIDLSAPALEVAARNCRRHSVEGQVHLLWGDLLSPLPRPVNLIVANLPYVAPDEVDALPPEVSSYEPRWAWYGGVGGLELIERLLAQAEGYLHDRGGIMLEIGAAQGSAVRSLAARYFPTARIEIFQDGAGLDRVACITLRAQSGMEAEGEG